MGSLKINKNVLLMIALFVVASAGYYLFTRNSEPELAFTTTGGVAGTPVVGQELVTELNRLQTLRNIDSAFLQDRAFSSLEDFTEEVPPQPLGRANPFAPVGEDF